MRPLKFTKAKPLYQRASIACVRRKFLLNLGHDLIQLNFIVIESSLEASAHNKVVTSACVKHLALDLNSSNWGVGLRMMSWDAFYATPAIWHFTLIEQNISRKHNITDALP